MFQSAKKIEVKENKPVGILKKQEASSKSSSMFTLVSNNPGAEKAKRGVMFNSKIHLEDGLERLKDEGQFTKPSRKHNE
jgi:hypothetical protein